ncbi:plastocyanin/azurin family copper-binding protein [Halobaculum sp. EA56]|uniref:plastocyanin/azurin family copper-binding protein n=1 Tax=Halobaculum sp. EA56 TaxID=3421648 RepID=UPI003EBFE408
MANQPDGADDLRDEPNEQRRWIPESTRRNLLKLGGASAVAAAVGGAGLVAGQEDDGDDEGDGDEEEGSDDGPGGSEAVLDDLVDPTFGYPLATDESDGVSLEHVVDVTAQEGDGDHPDFPSEPDPETPGSFLEVGAEFFFDPVGLHVRPGDLVHFYTREGLHTVTAFTELAEPSLSLPRRVPGETPPFTSPPTTPGQSWVYEFADPGVYDYFCFPHLGLGMVGRVVVFDPEEHDLSEDRFAGYGDEGLFPNDRRVLAAEELAPANVVEQGTVAWADLTIEPPTGTPDGTPTGTPDGSE